MWSLGQGDKLQGEGLARDEGCLGPGPVAFRIGEDLIQACDHRPVVAAYDHEPIPLHA